MEWMSARLTVPFVLHLEHRQNWDFVSHIEYGRKVMASFQKAVDATSCGQRSEAVVVPTPGCGRRTLWNPRPGRAKS